jgi:DNA-binding NtrC family response regulator
MNKKVLIVDDDQDVRKGFTLALEDSGCQVQTADCGEKAVEIMQDGAYGLIFLDLKMPGINGVETLRRIREIDGSVPIYIATAFQKTFMEELTQALRDKIPFDLLSKPVTRDQILTIVSAAMGAGGDEKSVKQSFKFYFAGESQDNIEKIELVKKALTANLKQNYELETVDVIKNPSLAIKAKIYATPTLLRVHPKPEKSLVGNLDYHELIGMLLT